MNQESRIKNQAARSRAKHLGQNFLRCQWVSEKIVKAAGLSPEDKILEVGPGFGALTTLIAPKVKQVIAVEKDKLLGQELQKELQARDIKNVDVIIGDILEVYPEMFKTHNLIPNSYKVVGNIPYYLTSRLIRILLESEIKPASIIFTIQKEVAERIMAKPPHMNLLALSVQIFGKPEIMAKVPASCFNPVPKVDSAVIKILDLSEKFFEENSLNKALFFKAIRASFGQKRKFLSNSLGSVLGREETQKAIKNSGLSSKTRPEELSLSQWARLIRTIEAQP